MTPAPPCHVQKSASVPFDGPESLMLFCRIGVVRLMELNTMQTGVEQPVQEPVAPTVLMLLTTRLNEKYSWPPDRSWRAVDGTAMAATTRAVFGPRAPMLYAPMPPADCACAQSAQFTAAALYVKFMASD